VGRVEKMITELVLYFIFAVLGLMIGLNWNTTPVKKTVDEELPKEIKKLQHELTVQKNVNESLLADVRYWRSKAKNDNRTT
jgi:hypothetical protein